MLQLCLDLQLTEEEQKLLTQEGVSLPNNLPLTKVGCTDALRPPRFCVRCTLLTLNRTLFTGRGANSEEGPEEDPQQAVGSGQPAAEEGVHRRAGEQVTGQLTAAASLTETPFPDVL